MTERDSSDLVVLRPEGMYCPAGDFYIDPWRPVATAVLTHGHADHARSGMGHYHLSEQGEEIFRWRLGDLPRTLHAYGEVFNLGLARVSLHSAGHVLGSAQVRIEVAGEVWVASGDYKRQPDPTCAPFEVVPCDTFITESTFGLPIYRWPDTAVVAQDMVAWRKACGERGEAAVVYAYSLGKAQRLIAEVGRISEDPIWLHGAVHSGVEVYRRAGVHLIETKPVSSSEAGTSFAGQLIIAPPSAAGSSWLKRFKNVQQGFASGWMQIRGNRRRKNYDRGFVVSDHADWPDLLRTVAETGARRVIATHGSTEPLVRLLQEKGLQAGVFATPFGEEEPETAP